MNGPELLKSWREAQGLSQEKAGALVDVHQNTWCDWERGEKAPRTTTALRIHALTEGACPVEAWSESDEVAEMYRRSVGLPTVEVIDPNTVADRVETSAHTDSRPSVSP